MNQEDDRPVIEPTEPICLLELLATLAPLDEDFLPVAELELEPVELTSPVASAGEKRFADTFFLLTTPTEARSSRYGQAPIGSSCTSYPSEGSALRDPDQGLP